MARSRSTYARIGPIKPTLTALGCRRKSKSWREPKTEQGMEMSMNIGPKTCVLALSLAGALTMNGPVTQARAQETHFSELANLPFAEGRPTAETTQKVHDELLFQRATQSYLWAMPLINTLGMQVGSEKTFGSG